MSDLDLDGFLASLPAHSEECAYLNAAGQNPCDCSVTETATALVAEVRRLNGEGDFPEWVGLLRNGTEPLTDSQRLDLANILVGRRWIARRLLARAERAEATIAEVRKVATRNIGAPCDCDALAHTVVRILAGGTGE